MNVAQKMREILPTLRLGIDNILLPGMKPECEEQWNEGYAIVNGVWYEFPLDNDYFDHDRFRQDYEAMVRSYFPGCDVTFFWGASQEIEVIKK